LENDNTAERVFMTANMVGAALADDPNVEVQIRIRR
jgi:hypothetical protein